MIKNNTIISWYFSTEKKIEMTFKSGYLFHVSLATRNKGAKWEWAKASIYLQRQASSDPCISTRTYCLQFLHLLRVDLLISDHALTDTPKVSFTNFLDFQLIVRMNHHNEILKTL